MNISYQTFADDTVNTVEEVAFGPFVVVVWDPGRANWLIFLAHIFEELQGARPSFFKIISLLTQNT